VVLTIPHFIVLVFLWIAFVVLTVVAFFAILFTEEAIPQTELVVIPAASHVCQLERPEQVNEAIRNFCRAHPPGSA
jgi:pimeloyl-ACP methyl ester carboxylesterase